MEKLTSKLNQFGGIFQKIATYRLKRLFTCIFNYLILISYVAYLNNT